MADTATKIRIFSLAKELGMDSKVLIEHCRAAGLTVKGSALASISPEEKDLVLRHMGGSARDADEIPAVADLPPDREEVTRDIGARVRSIRTMAPRDDTVDQAPAPEVDDAESSNASVQTGSKAELPQDGVPADSVPGAAAVDVPSTLAPDAKARDATTSVDDPTTMSREDYVPQFGGGRSAVREMRPRGVPTATKLENAREIETEPRRTRPSLPGLVPLPNFMTKEKKAAAAEPKTKKPEIRLTPDQLDVAGPLGKRVMDADAGTTAVSDDNVEPMRPEGNVLQPGEGRTSTRTTDPQTRESTAPEADDVDVNVEAEFIAKVIDSSTDGKIRIFSLAKTLGMDSKVLVEQCRAAGLTVKRSALASISPEETKLALRHIQSSAEPALAEHVTAAFRALERENAEAESVNVDDQLETDSIANEELPVSSSDFAWIDFDPSLLTPESLLKRGLTVHSSVCSLIRNSLLQRRHLLLWGPPGTGKTEIAKAISHLLFPDVPEPYVLATATASWTTFDVIGGPTLSRNGTRFHPGCFTEAVTRSNQSDGQCWLILDEINRADIDRAIGGMFTAMEDGVLRLPEESTSGQSQKGKRQPQAQKSTRTIQIPDRFRVIATMNNADKNNLFPLSLALLRRFALIHIPPIRQSDGQDSLIDSHLRGVLQNITPESVEFGERILASAAFKSYLSKAVAVIERLRDAASRAEGFIVPELQIGTASMLQIAAFLLLAAIDMAPLDISDPALDDAFASNLIIPLESLELSELEAVAAVFDSYGGDLPFCRQMIESWMTRQRLNI